MASIKVYKSNVINLFLGVGKGGVLYTNIYCAGDKIEKTEMGWACGAYG